MLFKHNKLACAGGFTFVELIIVVAVMVLIAGVALSALAGYRSRIALNGAVETITAQLSEARSRTVASDSALQYGVHFDTDAAVLFEGVTYSSSDPNNQTARVASPVEISAITLQGGGSEVIFDRLAGSTSQYGTLTVELTTTSETRTITIQQTGLVTVQ